MEKGRLACCLVIATRKSLLRMWAIIPEYKIEYFKTLMKHFKKKRCLSDFRSFYIPYFTKSIWLLSTVPGFRNFQIDIISLPTNTTNEWLRKPVMREKCKLLLLTLPSGYSMLVAQL